MPVYRGARERHQLGAFLGGAAEIEAQFHQPAERRPFLRDLVDGAVEIDPIGVTFADPGQLVAKRREHLSAASLLAEHGASLVGQNLPHQTGAEGHEMLAIVELGRLVSSEAEIELVNQPGCRYRKAVLPAQLAAGVRAQGIVNKRHQPLPCLA